MPLGKFGEANRSNWDERVAGHWVSDFYDIEGFKSGKSPLYQIDIDAVGDLTGKSLIHLQCHIGTDTLGLARLGADVTGNDLLGKSVKAARRLSEESGVPGRFFETDLYESPKIVNEQFDFVFTGNGAICWLPDIDAWGQIVADFLKPGGMFTSGRATPFDVVFATRRCQARRIRTGGAIFSLRCAGCV
jgi:SAM-dependent methyltransferase